MKQNYGVWGLGVVGKSVLRYLLKNATQFNVNQLTVMDKRTPTPDEEQFLRQHGIIYISQDNLASFFASNDIIIPSPGIDLTNVSEHFHKIITEIDLFYDAWKNQKKYIIGVTGTIGKTTVVHLLSDLLKHNGFQVTTGGNIGIPMFDILNEPAPWALLELSSFQLEKAKRFTADIAVITNILPNHLDRHSTLEAYTEAKYALMCHQNKPNQKALVPWSLRTTFKKYSNRPLSLFSMSPVKQNDLHDDTLYYFDDQKLLKITKTTTTSYTIPPIPDISFKENWLIILAVCEMLGLLKEGLAFPVLTLPAHRLQQVATINGLTFYNDSKSTIPQSTLAAVDHIHSLSSQNPTRIHLFLGGLSKGVDRSSVIPLLKSKIASISCFGVEADMLFEACRKAGITAFKHKSLEESFENCIAQAKVNDIILFSPSGSSFDLFKDYKERGEKFASLVLALEKAY